MTHHTLGPWKVDFETGEIIDDIQDNEYTIGSVIGVDGYYPCADENEESEEISAHLAECQANARLFAAAPELLHAVQELLARLDRVDPHHQGSDLRQFARTATAKAQPPEAQS